MWFKVVFNKDVSVASCDESSPSLSDGKHVFYVEADDKPKALHVARLRFEGRLKNLKDRRLAAGQCVSCGSPTPGKGRRCCQPCQDRMTQKSQESKDRAKAGTPLTAEERRERRLNSLRKGSGLIERAVAASVAVTTKQPQDHNWKTRRVVLRALRDVEDAYRRLSAPVFHAWLRERIELIERGGGESSDKAAE
jgi:hypothetical protein